MEYAKIILTPTSLFVSKLQSDTIFGHFAWGIRFLFGESRLKDLLKNFEENPFIIFSDGFEKGKLPKPLLKPYMTRDDELEYAKKIKKIQFIDKDFIFRNIDDLTDEKIFHYLLKLLKEQENQKENKRKKHIDSQITQKNSINRISNTVTEGLYSIKETFYRDFSYEIYFAYQNITQDEIKEVFDFISKRGYGKDKSTGKGKFRYKIDWEMENEKIFFITKREKFLNLSTAIYNPDNMELYFGKTATKFPKTGGYYAYSKPYKNPFIYFLPGSTFINIKNIPGKAEKNIYNQPNHYQNGFSIGIYFNGE